MTGGAHGDYTNLQPDALCSSQLIIVIGFFLLLFRGLFNSLNLFWIDPTVLVQLNEVIELPSPISQLSKISSFHYKFLYY